MNQAAVIGLAIIAVFVLDGCTSVIEHTAEIDDKNMKAPHPRALLLQRVMPSCMWFCTNTTTVTNSEGVKASGTGGNLSTSEAQTPTVTTQQTYSPSNSSSSAAP